MIRLPSCLEKIDFITSIEQFTLLSCLEKKTHYDFFNWNPVHLRLNSH